ncbi:AAAP family transporter: amino acid [Micractinium conductrix]|uniref:AAAP family transporter: amino acid n=1 Tax=Micractinium conductrix TaxID=554055 RepID=A0A2P6VC84_9CHLO|nr:AAAP family transporter: amino acid [Micractinium conductrix]|eukprot:PSC71694.1 AAAP family transporter: amino acid [Micractinium conductrix]
MLGRKASAAMSCVLAVYAYGSATAYLIILGDCFQPMLAAAFGQVWWTERDVVIAGMATAFMLPLCFPRTLNAISGFSSITFYALCCVVGSVIYRAVQAVQSTEPAYEWGALHAFRPLPDTLDALPILAFGFQCHTNLVAVFAELEPEADLFGSTASLSSLPDGSAAASEAADGPAGGAASAAGAGSSGEGSSQALAQQGRQEPQPPQRVLLLRRPQRRFVSPAQRTQKLQGMVQVLMAAICLTACFYTLVGLAGYLTFPRTALSNILLNYSNGDKLMEIARVLVGVIQIIHYPVNHFPARNATRDLLTQLTGRRPLFPGYNTVEVLVFFAATLGLSLIVTDLGQVFKVIGGSCGAFFIFGMPGALLLQYAYNKHLHLQDGSLLIYRQTTVEAPLLGGGEGGEPSAGESQRAQHAQQASRDHHFLLSKLWWAGCALILLGLGLLALTLYTILAPPVE